MRDLSNDDWIQTIKGNPFYLFEPKPDDFDVDEIAHALGMQCRFNGHVKQFYSVAQHSVLVSNLLESWGKSINTCFAGLMHDAAEAYLGDIVRPLKKKLDEYKKAEYWVEAALARKFGTPFPLPAIIKKADTTMLYVERRDLLAPPPRLWSDDVLVEGIPVINPAGPEDAKAIFLNRFYQLRG